jgi:hypothetical protein
MDTPTPPQDPATDTYRDAAGQTGLRPGDRAYFQWLANVLIVDDRLWASFYDRCKAIAAGGLYGHRNPNTVAGAVLKGYSLGMDFMEALSKLKVIQGNPTLRGPSAVAHVHAVVEGAKLRCVTEQLQLYRQDDDGNELGPVPLKEFPDLDLERLRDRLEDELQDPDDWRNGGPNPRRAAVWVMERPGWAPRFYVFTWHEAEAAGLPMRNENWDLYPDRCLKWQAASVGCQEMFGADLEGLYLAEEIENAPRTRREAAREPEPEPAHPPEPASRATLTEIGRRLRAVGVSYALACRRALGRELGSAKPKGGELDALALWLERVEAIQSDLANGQVVGGYHLKIYTAEFERWRPIVDRVSEAGRVVAWSGAARRDRGHATNEGVTAALLLVLEERPPDPGESDEPDPEKVAAAHRRLAEAQAEIEARNAAQGAQPPPAIDTEAHEAEQERIRRWRDGEGGGDGDGDEDDQPRWETGD